MEVRLEFESGTESSLILNAVLKVLKSRDGQRGTVLGIVVGTSIAFVGDVRQWGSTQLLDYYFSKEKRLELSDHDVKRIASACKDITSGKIASETSPKTRKARSIERLTLVSPVLLHAQRMWRFTSPFGEFSYLMEDEKFLDDLLTGKRRLTMKEGIQITAIVETDEVFDGGVWTPKQRHIIKVVKIHKKPRTIYFRSLTKAAPARRRSAKPNIQKAVRPNRSRAPLSAKNVTALTSAICKAMTILFVLTVAMPVIGLL